MSNTRCLFTNLNSFLKPFYISIHTTNIFEDTLSELAGAKKPANAEFGPGHDTNNDKLHILLKGIDTQDAVKFLNYLKKHDENSILSQMNDDVFSLTSNINVANEKILPAFKDAVEKMSPEQLAPYQKQSEHVNSIKEYKLLETIRQEMGELEAINFNEDTKGALRILLKNLNAGIQHELDHRHLDCDHFEHLIRTARLFLGECKSNEGLRDNPIIKNLDEHIKAFSLMCLPPSKMLTMSLNVRPNSMFNSFTNLLFSSSNPSGSAGHPISTNTLLDESESISQLPSFRR